MRLLITGASGTGTTTLGKILAERLKCGFIDADDYYWLPSEPPFQMERDPDLRLQLVMSELSKYESSIISGSVMNLSIQLEDSFEKILQLFKQILFTEILLCIRLSR